MPRPEFQLALKGKEFQKPDYVFEIVRTKDGFSFDEIGIKGINQLPAGAEVNYDYTRYGIKMTPLPSVISRDDFARLRGKSKDSGKSLRDTFVESDVAARLFADGAAFFNKHHAPSPEQDAMEDADFVQSLLES